VRNVVKNAENLPSGVYIYLFGSACYRQQPEDIDILYVYDASIVPSDTAYARFRPLSRSIEDAVGIRVHPTVLSTKELMESSFLERVEPIELRRT
jgi:hypothetical protein